MAYYIGIDGGGTSTVGCIGNEDGIIKSFKTGASNYKGSGRAVSEESIRTLLLELTEGLALEDVSAICFGGAGVDSARDIEVYKEIIASLNITDDIIVVNDAKSGLVGAIDGFAGAVVISGTGSILYGIDESGSDYRVGGWGHIIGDEGSGYTIGKASLTFLSKYFDGMIVNSTLLDAIIECYGLHTKESLINFVYNENTDKASIASLAKLVLDHYEEDSLARSLINDELSLLVEQVTQLYKNMGEVPMTLATIGSLLTKNELYRRLFIESLGRKLPSIKVIRAINTPEHGAYKIALKTNR